jgi:fructosamine-3-kinase
MKVIKQLHQGESKIELVDLNGEKLILRTAGLEDIYNEKLFIEELQKHKIKTLEIFRNESLKDNQLLLEYINGSPILADNLTDENIYNWGILIKKIHQIKFDKIFKIISSGKKEYCSWNDFIKERLSFAKLKIDRNRLDLTKDEISKVNEKLFKFKVSEPKNITLLHCDLNKYNILLKNNEPIIFDKGNQIFCGDYLFDLASVKIALTDRQLKEFIKGYGEDFTKTNLDLFEFYYLLRTIMRFPNPRKNLIGEVVKKLN